MKTICANRIVDVKGIEVSPGDENSCKILLDLYGDGKWGTLSGGIRWTAAKRYQDDPLYFIPLPMSDHKKYEVINLIEDGYSEITGEYAIEDWALEYRMFIRMVLDGYLMLNPTYFPLENYLEDILKVVNKYGPDQIAVDTCMGKIVARVIPDDEFPGIALLYENGDGEPGAVMEYTPTHETIQLRIYSAENPDDEPAETLDMVSEEVRKRFPNPEWILTDNDTLQYQKKTAPHQYHMVEMVWLDTARGDEGYPDKPYTVKSAVFDLADYSEEDLEIAISGYYPGLDVVRKEYGEDAEDIIAECIFENMSSAEASTSGMMSEGEAKKAVQEYILAH